MKEILIKSALLGLALANISFPQWSTDPNNNLIVGYGLNPDICSDSAGGCYITYEYGTTGYPRKLGLERLDKYGYKPWGDKIQILGELEEQWYAEIIEDGEGGVIISYLDDLIAGSDFIYRVRVQRIDSAGNLLWGQTGVRVTTEEINHGDQAIVSDGNGGCVVVWPNQLQNYTYNYRANRINNLGERAWSDTGIFLENSTNSQSASIVKASDGNYYIQTSTIYRINQNGQIVNQYYGNMLGQPVPDPEGGIVLTGVTGSIYNRRLVAQRKDTLGNNLWQEPYVDIADSLYINAIINVKRINNYYYYTWHGRKNGIDLVAQYQALRSDGTMLFNQDNLPISNYPVDALIGDIIPSESATFVIIWQDYRPDDGVFGQRKDTLNNTFWNVNDIPLYTGTYSSLHAITDCAGGAIGLGWNQFDFSIRVFKVSKNGILGEVITVTDDQDELILPEEIILYQNYPNPFNSTTNIKYTVSQSGRVSLTVYDIMGSVVAVLLDRYQEAGSYDVIFQSKDLASGIYFYTLTSGNFLATKKLILLK